MQVNMFNNNYNNRDKNISFKKIVRNDIASKTLKDNKYLLLVSGPSGVGKDSIMNQIMNKFNKIVTHTTRPKRAGEVDGKSYFFTTVDKFKEGIKNNEFVEYIEGFSGKYYGTKKETIKNALNGEKPALAIVDVDGAKNIRDNLKNDPQINVVSIFFRPPSKDPLKVLESRLNKRGSETAESIKTRLQRAEYEINRAKEYDAEIEVNNVEESLNDIYKLLNLD